MAERRVLRRCGSFFLIAESFDLSNASCSGRVRVVDIDGKARGLDENDRFAVAQAVLRGLKALTIRVEMSKAEWQHLFAGR